MQLDIYVMKAELCMSASLIIIGDDVRMLFLLTNLYQTKLGVSNNVTILQCETFV